MMASYRKMIKVGDVKITPAIAASQYNRQDGVKTTDGRKKHSQVMGGLQLDYKDLSFAVTTGKVSIERDKKSDNDYTSFDSIASYQFTKEFKVLGGYSFWMKTTKISMNVKGGGLSRSSPWQKACICQRLI